MQLIFIPVLLGWLMIQAAKYVPRQLWNDKKKPKEINFDYYKKTLNWVKRTYNTQTDVSLRIIQENFLTRALKYFGFAQELQTGNDSFDELFYIISDDPQTCHAFADNEELSVRFMTLYTALKSEGFILKEFLCAKHSCSFKFKPKGKNVRGNIDIPQLENLIDLYGNEIVEILSDPKIKSGIEPHAKLAKKVHVSASILWSFIPVILYYMAMFVPLVGTWYVAKSHMYLIALIVSSIPMGLYLWYVFGHFKGHSRMYGLALHPTLAFGLTTFLLTFILLQSTNKKWDSSLSSFALYTIEDKKSHSTRRNGMKFYIYIRSDNSDSNIKLRVSSSAFQKSLKGRSVLASMKEGFWHIKYIEYLRFLVN